MRPLLILLLGRPITRVPSLVPVACIVRFLRAVLFRDENTDDDGCLDHLDEVCCPEGVLYSEPDDAEEEEEEDGPLVPFILATLARNEALLCSCALRNDHVAGR